MGSDGTTDNTPVQTAQATDDVGNFALGRDFEKDRIQVQQAAGTAPARNALIRWSGAAYDQAPESMTQQTNPAMLAKSLSLKMGKPELFKNYKMMMRKRMKKMKKQ